MAYSDEEIKAFAEKDLRIVRQNAMSQANALLASGAIDGGKTNEEVMKTFRLLASECVAFVYEGMEFPGEKPVFTPTASKGECPGVRSDVLIAIATEAGIPSEMFDSLEAEIVRVFGKLPTNMKSVGKVIASIDLENVS